MAGTAEPREIELKFDVARADLPGLRRRIGAIEGAEGGREIQQLTTTYFDTPDFRLKSHGVSLRVRTGAGRRTQTVKAVGATGLYDRSEWEQEVRRPSPDLAAMTDTPVAGLLPSKRDRRKLMALFRTEVKRTVRRLHRHGGVVEVALDEAVALSGRRRASFCELELELKSGDAAALYALARDLIGTAPLRLGVLSKAERGYALREPESPQAVKAEAPRLMPGMSVADGFRAIVHSCLRQYRMNEAILLQRRDANALHQARVALRRMRSAFSLFKDVVRDHELDAIKDELRWASEPLGRARNHDVFLKHAAAGQPAKPGDVAGFLDLVRQDRDRAYDDVLAVLRSTRFHMLMLRLVEWLDRGPWTRRGGDDGRSRRLDRAAADILRSRRRKLRKRGRRLDRLDPEARHKIRIGAKKLRYAAEFFAPLWTGKASLRRQAKFLKALEAMQDALGDLNDIVNGHQLAAGLIQGRAGAEPAFAAGLIAGAGDARQPQLLRDAAAAARRLGKAKRFWR
jgi:inorganic triphosphatase YgiF